MPTPPKPPLADTAPTAREVTDYDMAHMTIYLRLLDAAAEGAPLEEVARIVLNIDPIKESAMPGVSMIRIWRARAG